MVFNYYLYKEKIGYLKHIGSENKTTVRMTLNELNERSIDFWFETLREEDGDVLLERHIGEEWFPPTRPIDFVIVVSLFIYVKGTFPFFTHPFCHACMKFSYQIILIVKTKIDGQRDFEALCLLLCLGI